jgi:hypothetical protein
VRANWRIIFRFQGAEVFDIELIDYHQKGKRHAHVRALLRGASDRDIGLICP